MQNVEYFEFEIPSEKKELIANIAGVFKDLKINLIRKQKKGKRV